MKNYYHHKFFIKFYDNSNMLNEFEYSGHAMGVDYYISIISSSNALADRLYKNSKNEIEENEKRFSRFDINSELSILNTIKEIKVSTEFFEVVEESYRLFKITEGAFNPLFSIKRFGYGNTFETINKDILPNNTVYDINFDSVVLNKSTKEIVLNSDQTFDFGGMLKGYLSEKIADSIYNSEDEVKGVIVNIGGDLSARGFDKNNSPFEFEILNPITCKEINISVQDKSLSTSGIYKRNWNVGNEKFHHILDRNGNSNPKNNIVSSSVVAEKGSESEAFAKTFLSLGESDATSTLFGQKYSYVIIENSGKIISNLVK